MAISHAQSGEVLQLPLGAALAESKTATLIKTAELEVLRLVLPAMTGAVATLEFQPDVAGATTSDGHALATELADWLVRRGMPFRQAHEVSGRAVKAADAQGVALWEVDLAAVDPALAGAQEALSVDAALLARSHRGGTAPAAVAEQLAQARVEVDAYRT